MEKNDFQKLFKGQTGELVKVNYSVKQGKIEINYYPIAIKYVDEGHFSNDGFGYDIKFTQIHKWSIYCWSSNSFEYYIFLFVGETIDAYLDEVNQSILKHLNKELSEIQESIDAINNRVKLS